MSEHAPHREATYEDLAKVPDHLVAELIDGELHVSPRPGSRHARAASRLAAWLIRYFDEGDGGPGGWWIVFEPELHLGKHALVPDIAGWRRERMPVYPDVAHFDIVPDWVCETVSGPTGGLDRLVKLPLYARYGVKHAWIVDPAMQGLEVYRLVGEHFSLIATHQGDERVRAEPFDACELPLAMMWI